MFFNFFVTMKEFDRYHPRIVGRDTRFPDSVGEARERVDRP